MVSGSRGAFKALARTLGVFHKQHRRGGGVVRDDPAGSVSPGRVEWAREACGALASGCV